MGVKKNDSRKKSASIKKFIKKVEKKVGVKKNGSKKRVGLKKIIKKSGGKNESWGKKKVGDVGKEISLLNESGVKKRIPFKSKYKGKPFIFICAEF